MLKKFLWFLVLSSGPAFSQNLDVAFETPRTEFEANGCGIHYVAGLNPNGDGFLAVRTGPSADHRKIDEVHNGDVIYACVKKGPWRGVLYTGSSQHNEHRAQHSPRKGWVHSKWLINGAG